MLTRQLNALKAAERAAEKAAALQAAENLRQTDALGADVQATTILAPDDNLTLPIDTDNNSRKRR